jgi:hypothetical protein
MSNHDGFVSDGCYVHRAVQDRLAMKHPTTRFKSLKVALKELEPFIRNGEHLQTGKPFKRFGGLRSRELLANWLLCVAFNYDCRSPDRLTFTSDPLGGDGILYDTESDTSFPTEHVLVPAVRGGKAVDVEALILKAIDRKRKKGWAAYASGKTLVVFLNAGGGVWHPNRVAKRVPDPLHFAVVWVVGLHHVEAGRYVYGVTQLDLSDGSAPTWLVSIGTDFCTWSIERIQ